MPTSYEADAGALSPFAGGDPRDLAPGADVDGFQILGILGRGIYGVTYLAREATQGAKAAIKLFQPDPGSLQPLAADDDPGASALAAFRREAAILGRLDHPNIARCRDFRDSRERPYIVLEPEEGHSLAAALVAVPEAFNEDRLHRILVPLLDALSHLHAKGILHRDIKPSNIHLRPDGSPVLLDFGAAGELVGSSGKTDPVSCLTPGFAAPEQYQKAGHEGPWTDIYGLAAVAYRAVTGKIPPDARDRLNGAKMLPARKLGAGHASPAFLAAIDWGLALTPGKRPQSAQDWTKALAVAAGEPGKQDLTPAAESGEAEEAAKDADLDDVPPTQRIKREPGVSDTFYVEGPRAQVAGPGTARPRASRTPVGLIFGILFIVGLTGGGWAYWQWTVLQNKTEWTVDPAGRGDTATIEAALAQARDGSTIRIQPGTYEESLVLSRPVTIEAVSADPADTVIAPSSGSCLTATAETGKLYGLTLRKAPGGGGEGCVLLVGSNLTLANSVIEAEGTPAVILHSGGAATLKDLEIKVSGGVPAVVVSNGARARMSDSSIAGEAAVGLLVRRGAAPEVIGNEIKGTKRAGMILEAGAAGRFEGNQIIQNAGTGVVIRGGSRPVFAKNRIESNGEAGVFIYEGARGELDSNVVTRNGGSGIIVGEGATPLLRKNEVQDNGDHGILLLERAGGRLEGNRVKSNKRYGLAISVDAAPDLSENEVTGNASGQTKKGKIATEGK
ncbi:MAG: right-handed parallel beta-helix repeat-containing protein [Kiloniellales bacterium]|nr:right-handed parallel beta-helix repeat-containing protein [Kiloniellales bacterium]